MLPCVMCLEVIALGEDFASKYEAALPHRTPCCRADCHPPCKSDDVYRCRLCACPLDNWKVDKDMEMVGDVLTARRMTDLNNIRRKNLPYDVVPIYKPFSLNI